MEPNCGTIRPAYEGLWGPSGDGTVYMEDRELVAAASGGDAAAFDELVRRYADLAMRVATVIVGNRIDADDVVQEATIRASRHLDQVRDGAAFRSWFLHVTSNVARDRLRGAKRHEALQLRLEHETTIRAVPSPETSYIEQESRRTLLEAVNTLSARDQAVIACRYFLELSEAETADALGCRPGTVKSRTSRALRRLESKLDRDDWRPADSSEEAS
jgi:RNA polymerase sigma factor (sigma-70 family)